eukprot:756759-Hanusia_phi.AAC.1
MNADGGKMETARNKQEHASLVSKKRPASASAYHADSLRPDAAARRTMINAIDEKLKKRIINEQTLSAIRAQVDDLEVQSRKVDQDFESKMIDLMERKDMTPSQIHKLNLMIEELKESVVVSVSIEFALPHDCAMAKTSFGRRGMGPCLYDAGSCDTLEKNVLKVEFQNVQAEQVNVEDLFQNQQQSRKSNGGGKHQDLVNYLRGKKSTLIPEHVNYILSGRFKRLIVSQKQISAAKMVSKDHVKEYHIKNPKLRPKSANLEKPKFELSGSDNELRARTQVPGSTGKLHAFVRAKSDNSKTMIELTVQLYPQQKQKSVKDSMISLDQRKGLKKPEKKTTNPSSAKTKSTGKIQVPQPSKSGAEQLVESLSVEKVEPPSKAEAGRGREQEVKSKAEEAKKGTQLKSKEVKTAKPVSRNVKTPTEQAAAAQSKRGGG